MAALEVSQLVMDANTTSTIISNINSLYSNAISQLITYTIGILAFVGIIIPSIATLYQSRQLKADHKALTETIATQMQEAKEMLTAELRANLESEKTALETKITKLERELNDRIFVNSMLASAAAHHLQANINISNDNYSGALRDCIAAINGYAIGKDEANLQIVLEQILLNNVLPKLKKSDFDSDEQLETKTHEAIASIEKINTNSRYALKIRALREALKGAMQRTD